MSGSKDFGNANINFIQHTNTYAYSNTKLNNFIQFVRANHRNLLKEFNGVGSGHSIEYTTKCGISKVERLCRLYAPIAKFF